MYFSVVKIIFRDRKIRFFLQREINENRFVFFLEIFDFHWFPFGNLFGFFELGKIFLTSEKYISCKNYSMDFNLKKSRYSARQRASNECLDIQNVRLSAKSLSLARAIKNLQKLIRNERGILPQRSSLRIGITCTCSHKSMTFCVFFFVITLSWRSGINGL